MRHPGSGRIHGSEPAWYRSGHREHCFQTAGAIAFGVGGRDFASHALKKLEDNMEKSDRESAEDRKED